MPNNKVLIVAGVCFLRAYAGTLHLARALSALGRDVSVLVIGTEMEAAEYATLDISVTCLVRREESVFLRKLETLRHRAKVFSAIFNSRRVILTENTHLIEASIAKWILKDKLILGHYSQELHLAEDYPGIPRIRMLNFLTRVPDFVVDVEKNRARIRMEKFRLNEMPMVLTNTLHCCHIPNRASAGSLEKLAGLELPPSMPVLLHMGGIGREKPLERVIDAISKCRVKVFFLAFCNGPAENIEALRQYAESKLEAGTFAILGPRRRDELLASAWEADIGVIDYSTSVENTYNQRYCAPTKLYEFMALGLAILGSDNDSLRSIVYGEQIGVCALGGSPHELGTALENIARNPDEMRSMGERAIIAFRERHCYERQCLPVVKQISEIFDPSTPSKL